MTQTELEIGMPAKRHTMEAFSQFCKGLKRPFMRHGNHIAASVIVTCYRKGKLERYIGSVLLMTGGDGLGGIRITDGERALRDQSVRQLLEISERRYDIGRSGRELVVECVPVTANDIYRIDLEEF